MSDGPPLRSFSFWKQREEMCLNTLSRALTLLCLQENLPEDEPQLNRLLYFGLLRAQRELYPDDEIGPIAECNNQPDANDASLALRESKRPDFQWIYVDVYEPDPERSSKQFVVECKRLGRPSRPDWPFNVNYVLNGVKRFRDPSYGYGQGFSGAAMVGYWQSMELPDVLSEVNSIATKESIPSLVISPELSSRVRRLEHVFERLLATSPFRLVHLWIDLRENYLN